MYIIGVPKRRDTNMYYIKATSKKIELTYCSDGELRGEGFIQHMMYPSKQEASRAAIPIKKIYPNMIVKIYSI
jgi:hypothetical protein